MWWNKPDEFMFISEFLERRLSNMRRPMKEHYWFGSQWRSDRSGAGRAWVCRHVKLRSEQGFKLWINTRLSLYKWQADPSPLTVQKWKAKDNYHINMILFSFLSTVVLYRFCMHADSGIDLSTWCRCPLVSMRWSGCEAEVKSDCWLAVWTIH